MSTKTREPVEEEVVEERPNDIEEVLKSVMPYWRPIAGVLALLLGLLVVTTMLSGSRKAAEESAWASFMAASGNGDTEMLQEIASTGSGDVAMLAQYKAAQSNLIKGNAEVHKNRDSSRVALNAAVDGFTKTIERSTGQELIEQRAIWGLGQAYEGLNDLGKAKTQYQKLVEKFPEAPLSKRAEQRVVSLDDPATKEFYDWFFTQNPADKLTTGDVKMPSMKLPGSPDFSVPDPNLMPADDNADDTTSESSAPAPDLPSAPAAEDATSTPAEAVDATVVEGTVSEDAATVVEGAVSEGAATVIESVAPVVETVVPPAPTVPPAPVE